MLQRLKPIYIGYDEELENQNITYENWKDFMKKFRAGCANYAHENGLEEAPGELTTRDIYSLRETIDNNCRELAWIVEENFTQTKDPEFLIYLRRYVGNAYGIPYESITAPSNYANKRGVLKNVPSKEIAKTFIYQCKYLRGNNE